MNSGWFDCCRTLLRPRTNQGHLNQDPLHRFAEWKKTTWHFNLIMDENHYHYFWIHWDRSIDTFFARTQRGYMTSAPTTLQGTSVNKKPEAHIKGFFIWFSSLETLYNIYQLRRKAWKPSKKADEEETAGAETVPQLVEGIREYIQHVEEEEVEEKEEVYTQKDYNDEGAEGAQVPQQSPPAEVCNTIYYLWHKYWSPLYQDLKRAHSTQNTQMDPERLSRRNKRS